MKYLVFDQSAIDTLIRSNDLTSIIRFLNDENYSLDIDYIFGQKSNEGIVFVGIECSRSLVVFDLTKFDFLSLEQNKLSTILRKIFGFSIRFWNGMPFVSCEHIFGTKAAIFPFPFTVGEADHVVVRRNPPCTKFSNCILAYDFNNQSTIPLASSEDPDFSIFDLAVTAYESALNYKNNCVSINKNDPGKTSIVEEYNTQNGQFNQAFTYLKYEKQLELLTPAQRDVVESTNRTDPIRIEGPAGTGKTTSMVLRAIRLLLNAQEEGRKFRILYITHSESTKNDVQNKIMSLLPTADFFRENAPQCIQVSTLYSWCSKFSKILENQLIEKAPEDSKKFQFELLSTAYHAVAEKSYKTYRNLISEKLRMFLEQEDEMKILLMLQYEFSIRIKGMAHESLDQYKTLKKLQNGIPLCSDDDVVYIFKIFTQYCSYIQQLNVYDTDDVAIETLNRLDGPIWRRKRERDGYDYIFADEIHLFNLNEQNIIHFLTKDYNQKSIPICFALDYSQAIGERGDRSDYYFEKEMKAQNIHLVRNYSRVFRNSPYIMDLCAAITASGATLFQYFNNPYSQYEENFDITQKDYYTQPLLFSYDTDEAMRNSLESHITELSNQLKCPSREIAIIFLDTSIIEKWGIVDGIGKYSTNLIIDNHTECKKSNSVFVSTPDFISGLEFTAVILPAVDKGRVPPSSIRDISKNFLKYSALNQLYLSCSRARLGLRFLENSTRGRSECLDYPIEKKTIKIVEAEH